MNKGKIIAYDLGTGGNKASLYDARGACLESAFVPYETLYPRTGWHEQSPEDWWDAVVKSTRLLNTRQDTSDVECISISGHSLGAVPLDGRGELLRKTTPIWSDTRAEKQVERFFSRIDQGSWYMRTGNGFPPACYTVFKIMWYRDQEPELFRRTALVIGTKDYINYLLTGRICTDFSYASGSGVYDLKGWRYDPALIEASGLPAGIFPEIVPSTRVVGRLSKGAAKSLGLTRDVRVVAGGVDNSCMAVGAGNIAEGRVYTSLGSSSWIAVSSTAPVLDEEHRPFVFTHVVPGMFTSAVSIFSAGRSLNWVKDVLCANLDPEARQERKDPYDLLNEYAARSPVGANGLLFNPSLAGGSSQESSPHIRGAFMGIDLGHTQEDVIRAAMEGVALNLTSVLDVLRSMCTLSDHMVMVGGGSKSRLWLQIFADTYEMNVVKTNVGRDAGSLGAAAVGAVGCGLWDDFSEIDRVCQVQETVHPDPNSAAKYRVLRKVFEYGRSCQSAIGEMLHGLDR
jgi:xylulokinase